MSLLIGQVISFSTLALLLCLIWRLGFPFIGPGWWTSSYAAAALGLILLALRHVLPDFLAIACGNVLTLASLTFSWNGLRLFMDKPGFTKKQWGLVVLYFACFAAALHWLTAVHDIIQIRIMLYTLSLSGIMALIVREIRPMTKTYRALRLLSFLFILYICILIVRMFILTLLTFSNTWGSFINALFVLFTNMFFIGFAFCYIMLISERLLQVIVEQYKSLEENMRFRQQMESLLYHDLKSPMMPAVYLPDMLLKTESLSEKGKSSLIQIKEAALRIMNLINDALTAHTLEAECKLPNLTEVDLLGVINKAQRDLTPLQRANGAAIALQVDNALRAPGAAIIQGDENLLYRMCSNLLKNALQASPRGANTVVSLKREQERLRIEISNSGEVPEPLRASFFEKYSRGEGSRGMGLGTYSARLVAQAHGGEIQLYTDTPGMTRVAVRLPVTQPETTPGQA